MQTIQRKTKTALTAFLSLALSLGLLCNIVCAVSNCHEIPTTSVAGTTSEPSHHCHQTAESPTHEQAAQPFAPAPDSAPHRCTDHQLISSLSSQEAHSEKGQSLKTAPALYEPFHLFFPPRVPPSNHTLWHSRKSPPFVGQHSILRI